MSGISKPMVCQTYGFHAGRLSVLHENDGNHENEHNDEDNSDSYKQGVKCWILSGNHRETTEMTKTTGIRGANHGFQRKK